MSRKQQLKHSIHQLLKETTAGSYSTKAARREALLLCADDLYQLNITLTNIRQLKSSHIEKMVQHWQQNKLAASTIKNRMSHIRFACRLMNKANIVKSNNDLGIEKRSYLPTYNRAIVNPDLSQISNEYVRISLELQRVFGLRREESLKIKPHMADKGDKLELQASWCKGGRSRSIPILIDEQRHWLNEAKQIAKRFDHSLIPIGKTYIQQRYIYDKQVQRHDLKNPHGLRHAYAQRRYKDITGWEAPINGGPSKKDLTLEQRALDFKARMIISEELGHSREHISKVYLGR